MLNVTNLFVNSSMKLVLGGSGQLEGGLGQEFLPKLLLFLLFTSEFLINFIRNFFRGGILLDLDAIDGLLDTFTVADDSLGISCGLIEEESSLDLVLPLLVPGRCGLIGHIPAMVVDVTSITTGVGCLWVAASDGLIFETVTDQEITVGRLQIFIKVTTKVLRPVGSGQRNTVIPTAGLGAQQVLVDLILYNAFGLLHLRWHMDILIEEGMLRTIIDLTVLH